PRRTTRSETPPPRVRPPHTPPRTAQSLGAARAEGDYSTGAPWREDIRPPATPTEEGWRVTVAQRRAVRQRSPRLCGRPRSVVGLVHRKSYSRLRTHPSPPIW